jgi:hypothetical protein
MKANLRTTVKTGKAKTKAAGVSARKHGRQPDPDRNLYPASLIEHISNALIITAPAANEHRACQPCAAG